jgi:hypothetical protein
MGEVDTAMGDMEKWLGVTEPAASSCHDTDRRLSS